MKKVNLKTEIEKLKGKNKILKAMLGILIFCSVYVYLSPFIAQASLSLKYDCSNLTQEQIQDQGTVVLGSFNPGNDTITINVPQDNPYYKRIQKHENIHFVQKKEGRFYSCNFKPGLFLDELEAYIGETLPDSIYEFYYGKLI